MTLKQEQRTMSMSSPMPLGASTSARRPRFFVGASIIFVILSVAGFGPSFFRDQPVPPIAIGHGLLMLGWLALFAAQATLVSAGNVRLHRRLGVYSIGLAAVIWISMAVATVTALRRLRPELDSFLFDVLMVQLDLMALFALFYGWGFRARHEGAAHKRLMLLATLMLVQAGLDRMSWQPLPGPMLVWILLVALWVFDAMTLRRVHRVTWIGTALIVASHVAIILLWGWPAWHRFVFGLLHSA